MNNERAKVLLIEDDPIYRNLISSLLVAPHPPFELITTERLASGMEKLAEVAVELVLLDLELPDCRGIDTFLQVHSRHPQIPIIVLISHENDDLGSKAMDAGAQDYLVKAETDRQLLRRAIRYAIARQRSESALRESQRLIQEIADATPEILTLFDLRDKRIVYINRQITNLLGYTVDDLQENDLRDFIHPDDLSYLNEQAKLLLSRRDSEVSKITYRARHTNGEWRWLRSQFLVFTRGENGGPLQILSTTRDITESKRIDDELRQSEERYRDLFENAREQAALLDCAQDAIMVRDLEGRILFWNRSAERIFGWRADEALGKTTHARYMSATSGQIAEAEMKIFETGEWTGEMWQLTKDGREIIVESRWTLVRDDQGKPKSILEINTDITEKKRLESLFLRMQRMDSIGALASGIAHDLNNSLAPILMALHTLQQTFTDPNSQRLLSLIRRSTERSRDLIDKVLTFAKGAEGERLTLTPSRLISDVAKILNETLPKSISLTFKLPEDMWNLVGDPTQIHQVLMNLCINARDAMPRGGALTITAENITFSEKQVWMMNEVAPGRFVQITVVDTGIGMSAELIDRAFEPFFTTKPQGQGSGLGLSTSAGIVSSHKGFINVTSSVGKGSQFRVYIPAKDNTGDPQRDSGEIAVPSGNNELILVVEDEIEVRDIIRLTVEANGYRTLGASDGVAGLSLYRQHRDEINLVLSDLSMPGMDGVSMSRAIREIDPQVKIIGISGLRQAESSDELYRAGIRTVLCKPFTAPLLLRAIAIAIDED